MNIGDKYLNLIFLYGIWQDVGILFMGNFGTYRYVFKYLVCIVRN